ncbi:hypothetical protein LAZ67_9001283 [Cordylochernes scorpioides]|uniref:Reverse transcriptase domain-containing protein n=1 Tax=Cordylochernes scorpioides TaxID=51811 RepID=A0ABY6KTF7_9ARAC|nr:hypothetical protein LAZ67_9001283 [Cordylochernes scorpioides]
MPGHRKRRQFKQTDAFTRGMVIGLKMAGWSIRQIAADTHLGASTVHRLWRRWLEQGNVAIYRNVGATRVTSARVDRRILRQAVAAPQATCTAILQHVQDTLDHSISTRTISRRLVANGSHSCRPLRRLPLTPPNRRQRLEWCRARSTWMTEWHRVVFSDESRFCLSSDSRRVRVWRRRGERSNPAAIVEHPTVRQRGIMVWGAIAYDSRSPLLRIQGTMTAQRYVDDVLRPVTLPYLQGVPNALYQQDNARPHTARISQQALQDVQMLPWPPYSPDLSPIEHVWDIIGRRLHALPQPRSEDELWQMDLEILKENLQESYQKTKHSEKAMWNKLGSKTQNYQNNIYHLNKTDNGICNTGLGSLKLITKMCLGKVLDSLLAQRLKHWLESNELLSSFQHGFRKGKSTTTALNEVLEGVEMGLNKGAWVLFVALDIDGAFNSMSWNKLMRNLMDMGCPDNLCSLILDFLRDRQISLSFGGRKLERNCARGCPQGSCCGPILWNILVNTVFQEELHEGDRLVLYADDQFLIIETASRAKAEKCVEASLQIFSIWAHDSGLKFNVSKTKALSFKPRDIRTKRKGIKWEHKPAILMEGRRVALVNRMTILGVVIDDKMGLKLEEETIRQKIWEKREDALGLEAGALESKRDTRKPPQWLPKWNWSPRGPTGIGTEVFTDGSKSGTNTGAGVVIYTNGELIFQEILTLRVDELVYSAELVAIRVALRVCAEKNFSPDRLYSDCMSALVVINLEKGQLAHQIIQELEMMTRAPELPWFRRHSLIEGLTYQEWRNLFERTVKLQNISENDALSMIPCIFKGKSLEIYASMCQDVFTLDELHQAMNTFFPVSTSGLMRQFRKEKKLSSQPLNKLKLAKILNISSEQTLEALSSNVNAKLRPFLIAANPANLDMWIKMESSLEEGFRHEETSSPFNGPRYRRDFQNVDSRNATPSQDSLPSGARPGREVGDRQETRRKQFYQDFRDNVRQQ